MDDKNNTENPSEAIQNLKAAFERAIAVRPKVGGFPYLAEVLRRAGVTRNICHLPSCQSLYLTGKGVIINQSQPLLLGLVGVPDFDQTALINALRTDQAGESTFSEFLTATWQAGVVRYEVDFLVRQVTYYGCNSEDYTEEYFAVKVE